MLEIKNLCFSFDQKPLFSDITFDLGKGEIFSILGRNGTGKTTLLKCILGLYKNYSGYIKKVDITGYVPQKVFSTFDLSVEEMIVMGRMPYLGFFGMPDKKDYTIARRKAEELGITHLLDKSFLGLSGGEKQIVLIARALCLEAELLVFDEPMSALDYNNQNKVLKIIKRISQNSVSVIFTTHDPTHAVHIADKILLMKDSNNYHYGLTESVLTDEVLQDVYDIPLLHQTMQGNTIIVPFYDK